MAPIAEDFKISKIPVELFGMILPALGFALFLNRIFDGIGRPFFGWLSDQIGREYTMALAFLIGAAALFTLSRSGSNPVTFVLVTALYFGMYGEIFSLFPATQGDTFGSKYAAANNGMLYTAKGAGSLLVPIAAIIAKSHGWSAVFCRGDDIQRPGGPAGAFRVETHARTAFRQEPRGLRKHNPGAAVHVPRRLKFSASQPKTPRLLQRKHFVSQRQSYMVYHEN